MMGAWRKFVAWHESFYTSTTLVLSARSGGEFMQMSPLQVAGSLLNSLQNKSAPDEDDYEEGCLIEPHDEFRLRQIVTPEEFCELVNANAWEGMTWAEAEANIAKVKDLVELE